MTHERVGVLALLSRFPQARDLWSVQLHGQGPARLDAFWLGHTVVIIHDYGDGTGWQAYTPTTDDGRTEATLDAIAERCGVVAL